MEKRKYERTDCIWKALDAEKELGQILNMSEGGFHVLLVEGIQAKQGDTFNIHIIPPGDIDIKEIFINTKVKWANSERYGKQAMGVEFVSPDNETLKNIKEVIKYFENEPDEPFRGTTLD